jgi:hypothetical protein
MRSLRIILTMTNGKKTTAAAEARNEAILSYAAFSE